LGINTPADFLPAKEAPLKAFDKFDATAEWGFFAGVPGVTTSPTDVSLDQMFH
jgi:hypothetical protein